MMPAAIYYSFTGEGVRYHFESPSRFVTPDEALDLGLITADESVELQRKTQAWGWVEGEHETP